jgi:hypothetical protein
MDAIFTTNPGFDKSSVAAVKAHDLVASKMIPAR